MEQHQLAEHSLAEEASQPSPAIPFELILQIADLAVPRPSCQYWQLSMTERRQFGCLRLVSRHVLDHILAHAPPWHAAFVGNISISLVKSSTDRAAAVQNSLSLRLAHDLALRNPFHPTCTPENLLMLLASCQQLRSLVCECLPSGVATLLSLDQLRALSLSFLQEPALPDLSALSNLRYLRIVNYQSKEGLKVDETLRWPPLLEHLSMEDLAFEDGAGDLGLWRCSNLATLQISATMYGRTSALIGRQRLPVNSLRTLGLAGGQLSQDQLLVMGVPLATNLEHLDLSINRLSSLKELGLDQMARLETLDLSYNTNLHHLQGLDISDFPALRSVCLDAVEVPDWTGDLHFMSKELATSALERLSLAYCGLVDVELAGFDLRNARTLKTLRLYDNSRITDEGIKALNLQSNTSLQEVYLGYNTSVSLDFADRLSTPHRKVSTGDGGLWSIPLRPMSSYV